MNIIKRDGSGLIVLVKPGVVSIPAEIGTSMTGREAWEELYKPRLTFSEDRVPQALLERLRAAGGVCEKIEKPGADHHPHSLDPPDAILAFLDRHLP